MTYTKNNAIGVEFTTTSGNSYRIMHIDDDEIDGVVLDIVINTTSNAFNILSNLNDGFWTVLNKKPVIINDYQIF